LNGLLLAQEFDRISKETMKKIGLEHHLFISKSSNFFGFKQIKFFIIIITKKLLLQRLLQNFKPTSKTKKKNH